MSVDKIILRAFLTTLASIAILFLFMLTALVCVYPQTMMSLTYDLGMENASIWFAEISYDRFHDVYYIAHATEVAIGQQDYKKIESCGELLIDDEEFDEFSAKKTENMPTEAEMSYQQYVYGQVCIAKYERGMADKAIERAFASIVKENGEFAFPKNNAVVAVLITALRNGDGDTVGKIREKMNMQTQVSTEDQEYFEDILALIESE